MKNTLLFVALSVMVLGACSKPDNVESVEDRLRGGKWKQTGGKLSYYIPERTKDTLIDYFSMNDSCIYDNSFEFNEGLKGTQFFGDRKCLPGQGDQKPFDWEVSQNDTKLAIYNAEESFQGYDDVNATIIALSSNRLVLEYKVIDVDTFAPAYDTATITNVYKR